MDLEYSYQSIHVPYLERISTTSSVFHVNSTHVAYSVVESVNTLLSASKSLR